ncbi:MAG: 30S ribosome-binding factor RbfA [Lachnospiraceae bacterium]|nr:30S ribosome-binding factor RbfA [Lachnospiraceae bacterium]
MRKNSVKNTRINEEVMRELSNIIREKVKDPRISPIVSVLSVEVAPDLKTAKAYISVLGSEEDLHKTMEGLKASAGFIRRELAHELNLRNTPDITFCADTSIAYGVKMSKLIDEVNKDLPPEETEE